MKHGLSADKAGIKITRFPYEEPYNLRLFLEASNGKMNGGVEYYCNADDLSNLGNKLLGFIGKRDEKIIYELGSEKVRFAFFFSLQVISLDATGHSAIRLRMNNNRPPPATEACEFCIPTDVADINRLGSLLVAFGKLEHRILEWSAKDGKLWKDVTFINSELSQKLYQIETEMRRIGYWQENPPDLAAKFASGEMRSYLDAPSFELWLQTIFLPNARRAVQTNNLLADSQVGLMALRQYDYHSSIPEAHGLMQLLNEFDDLVRAHKCATAK